MHKAIMIGSRLRNTLFKVGLSPSKKIILFASTKALKIMKNVFIKLKEKLKIRCHIYISMKKGIILRKIHAKMKSFAPPFSTIERN